MRHDYMRSIDKSKVSSHIRKVSKLRNQYSACYGKRCSSVCKAGCDHKCRFGDYAYRKTHCQPTDEVAEDDQHQVQFVGDLPTGDWVRW